MQDQNLPLLSCARADDTALFAELFYRRTADVNLDYQGEDGETALKLACGNGNIDIATLLISAGCDVNKVDAVGEGPLYAACSLNRVPVVKLLLQSGVNVNLVNQEGASAVYIAALRNHCEVLRLLIAAGASVALTDQNGATALHMVSEHADSTDAAALLVAAGADVNALNKFGWTPLHDCAQEGNVLAVSFLLGSGADANLCDMDGWTPLYIAAQNGHSAVVKTLIKAGCADVDAVDKEGNTALMVASKYGQAAVAELLLLAGADYFLRNQRGRRARDLAVQPALRAMFKGFDLSLAAARLYTRHHRESDAYTADTTGAAPAAADAGNGTAEGATGAGVSATDGADAGSASAGINDVEVTAGEQLVAQPRTEARQPERKVDPASPGRPTLQMPLSPAFSMTGMLASQLNSPLSPVKPARRSRSSRQRTRDSAVGFELSGGEVSAMPADSPRPADAESARDTTNAARQVGRTGAGAETDGLTEKLLATITLLTSRVDALQEALLAQQQKQQGDSNGAAASALAASVTLRSSKGRWMGDGEDAPSWAEWARTEAQLATAGLAVVAVLLIAAKALLLVLTFIHAA